MRTTLRTFKLDDEQYARLKSSLDATQDMKPISKLLEELLNNLALQKQKTWDEIDRIADVDPVKGERALLSHITKEIVVYTENNNV